MKIYWYRPYDPNTLLPSEACAGPPKQQFPLTLARHLRLYSQLVEVRPGKPLDELILQAKEAAEKRKKESKSGD